MVETMLVDTCACPSGLSREVRRMGNRAIRYPIYDVEWRESITIHGETRWYAQYVESLGGYHRDLYSGVIRLEYQMATCACGYRLDARELHELNPRKRRIAGGAGFVSSRMSYRPLHLG